MPVYNDERFVAAALESVRDQGSEEIEVVVVDDGAKDRTIEIVRGFMNRMPLRLIAPGRLGNWVAVTNIGLQEATGEWACFLHCDDLWLPGKLTRLRRELDRAESAMVLHNSLFIGPDGKHLGPWTCPLFPGLIPPEEFLEHLLVQNFIATCAPTFRRETAIRGGGMDEALWHTADWDLWLKLGSLADVRFLPEALSAFRVHPESLTVAHRLHPGEWEQQLMTVFQRHFPRWRATGRRRAEVQRAAMASITINSTLAAAARGESVRWREPLLKLLALGPSGWRRYVRDSRITERLGSRLKLRLSLRGASRSKAASTT